jgi:hypothetical protein
MGFLDKAKEAAEKAMAATQQVAQQGQHKIETMQQAKTEGELLKALGEAVYGERRHGGAHAAVDEALSALDSHHVAVAAAAAAQQADGPPAAADDAPPAQATQAPEDDPPAPSTLNDT